MKKSVTHIPIVFLVCRGRSGSTLLQNIFDSHPNICAPLESKFILHLKTKYYQITNWNEKTISSLIKDLYTNRKFRLFWNVSPLELRELFNEYNVTNFSDACKIIHLSHPSKFEKKEINLIIDKNPIHSKFIPELLALFPSAKFIHLIRDPRASSYSHVKWLLQKNIAYAAYGWNILNTKTEKIKLRLPEIFFTIKYENLVTTPQEELIKLFNFLQLSFNKELLDARNSKKVKSDNKYLSLDQHDQISSPINDKNLIRWKTKLNNTDQGIINVICQKLMHKYEYPFQLEPLSLKSHLKIKLAYLRSKIIHWIPKILFQCPFWFRSFLFNLVSLVKDKKYKN